jgi:hypothetical protein
MAKVSRAAEAPARKSNRMTLAAVGVTVVVVLAAAVLLVGLPFNAKTPSTTSQPTSGYMVSVLSDNLTVGAGSGLWGITIENSGGAAIKEMTAVLSTPVRTMMCTGYDNLLTFVNCPTSALVTPYAPGTTVRSYASGAGPGSAVPGQSYQVVLVVSFVGGVDMNFTSSVTAQGA